MSILPKKSATATIRHLLVSMSGRIPDETIIHEHPVSHIIVETFEPLTVPQVIYLGLILLLRQQPTVYSGLIILLH